MKKCKEIDFMLYSLLYPILLYKKVSEFDMEMKQSQTADQHTELQKRLITINATENQKNINKKAFSSIFLSEQFPKLIKDTQHNKAET